jgi:hypothetical protein
MTARIASGRSGRSACGRHGAVRTAAAHQRWNLRAQELGRLAEPWLAESPVPCDDNVERTRDTLGEGEDRRMRQHRPVRRAQHWSSRRHAPTSTPRLPSRPERCVIATNVWKRAGALRSSAATCSGVRDHDIPFRVGSRADRRTGSRGCGTSLRRAAVAHRSANWSRGPGGAHRYVATSFREATSSR